MDGSDQAPNVQFLLCTLLLLSLGTGLGLWSLGAENQQKTKSLSHVGRSSKNEPMPIAISSQHQVFFKRIVSFFSESSFHQNLILIICLLLYPWSPTFAFSASESTLLKTIYIVTSQQNIADPMKAQGFLSYHLDSV